MPALVRANQFAIRQDPAFHGVDQGAEGGVALQRQGAVEGEDLEVVVVHAGPGRRARAEVAERAVVVLALDPALRRDQVVVVGQAFRQ